MNLRENGFGNISTRKRVMKNAAVSEDVPTKLSKHSEESSGQSFLPDNFGSRILLKDSLKGHKSTLLRKMLRSLMTHSPEMFVEVRITIT